MLNFVPKALPVGLEGQRAIEGSIAGVLVVLVGARSGEASIR